MASARLPISRYHCVTVLYTLRPGKLAGPEQAFSQRLAWYTRYTWDEQNRGTSRTCDPALDCYPSAERRLPSW